MRLLIDVTAHGWGHLAQTGPIIAALRTRLPDLQCITRSALPPEIVAERLGPLEQHIESETDFGLAMQNPFEVDRKATLERFKAVHRDFDAQVAMLSELMRQERCDAVFSNVGYFAVAAGKQAGIPTIACSSLNWSDMFRFYCSGMACALEIQAQIDWAYSTADLFLRLAPGMPMARFHTKPIARPIARVGTPRRQELEAQLRLPESKGIVLCAFAGMLPQSTPDLAGILRHYTVLGPEGWAGQGVTPLSQIAMRYQDIMASVDAVVTKAGYGVVAELGCLGKPSIMISRGDWPEQRPLLEWLSHHATVRVCADITALGAAEINDVIALACAQTLKPISAGGEADAAEEIILLLESYKGKATRSSNDPTEARITEPGRPRAFFDQATVRHHECVGE